MYSQMRTIDSPEVVDQTVPTAQPFLTPQAGTQYYTKSGKRDYKREYEVNQNRQKVFDKLASLKHDYEFEKSKLAYQTGKKDMQKAQKLKSDIDKLEYRLKMIDQIRLQSGMGTPATSNVAVPYAMVRPNQALPGQPGPINPGSGGPQMQPGVAPGFNPNGLPGPMRTGLGGSQSVQVFPPQYNSGSGYPQAIPQQPQGAVLGNPYPAMQYGQLQNGGQGAYPVQSPLTGQFNPSYQGQGFYGHQQVPRPVPMFPNQMMNARYNQNMMFTPNNMLPPQMGSNGMLTQPSLMGPQYSMNPYNINGLNMNPYNMNGQNVNGQYINPNSMAVFQQQQQQLQQQKTSPNTFQKIQKTVMPLLQAAGMDKLLQSPKPAANQPMGNPVMAY